MGSCGGGGGVRPTQKMLLSASILLLLGFSSSALAGGHGNSMGCCNEKLVTGSGPKSGIYYLDTEASVDTFPDVCMDECVYVKESGSGRFCFKPSSMYTSECMGDSEDHETGNMITIDSDGHESMGGHEDHETTCMCGWSMSDQESSASRHIHCRGSIYVPRRGWNN